MTKTQTPPKAPSVCRITHEKLLEDVKQTVSPTQSAGCETSSLEKHVSQSGKPAGRNQAVKRAESADLN